MEKALELLETPNEEIDSVEGNQQRSLNLSSLVQKRSETILYGVGGKRLTTEAGATLTELAEGNDIVRSIVKAIVVENTIYKWCNSCKLYLPLEAFTNRKSGTFGKDYQCRVCKRAWNGSPKALERTRRYFKSEKGRLQNKKRWKVERQRRPLEHRARQAVYRAVCSGKLVRPKFCSKCGSNYRIQAHHEDYSKFLEVEWFCEKCHKEQDSILGQALGSD